MYLVTFSHFSWSGNVTVLMLLLIWADIDDARTVFASLAILGPISSPPVAFVEFNSFINSKTQSVDPYANCKENILWNFAINK